MASSLCSQPWLEEKASFLEKGFGILPDMISEGELIELGKIYDRCFDDEQRDGRKALGGVDQEGRQSLPQILNPSKIFPELRDLGIHERCLEAARVILDDPDAELGGEHMILKPAGHGVETPWHQDQAYHDPSLSYRNINFWFPLDGASVEEGCLQFVEGSHLGSVVLPHTYLIPGDRQSAMVARDQDYWSMNGVPVPCPRRACTLHHSYCLHYAGPNLSGRDRRAFILSCRSKPILMERPWVFPWNQD